MNQHLKMKSLAEAIDILDMLTLCGREYYIQKKLETASEYLKMQYNSVKYESDLEQVRR